MAGELSPGLILIVGALLVPFLRGRLRGAYMLALPVLAAWQLLSLPYGSFGGIEFLDMPLVTLRVDRLSFVFGLIFLMAAFLGIVYSLHLDDNVQHVAGLVYAGSAVGAVFAGDLVTLFIYWEGTAIASVFLIWARREERAYRAGLRYLVIQVGSGVLLLAGVIIQFRQTGSIAFDHLGTQTLAGVLIFLAFGIKCAFPLLHNWLQDAYPEATVTGTVMLSAFTTKLAVYALARGYAGTEILVPIGAAMAAFPIFYAVIENDLRRVLAYSLNNQLGFMVVGIGIGTELAINGTVAHAFCHILYKALLFMSMGAVLFRTGTVKGSELGGLYKSMPWTTGFCIVGAASISGFPLFSGFISKAMIITAAMDGGYFWTWIVLLFASAGVFHHSGIKIPYFAFFSHDSGKRCAEAPGNMLVAMAVTAGLCILIGVYPRPLYDILPYSVDFLPYTLEHVVTQLQLLMFSALAFTVLMRTGIYPPEMRRTNLDFDWVYRRLLRSAALAVGGLARDAWKEFTKVIKHAARGAAHVVAHHHGPDGIMARTWPTGVMAFWTTVMLAAYLILTYL
ncbi:Na(+)/H(+) antiporter subunit D [Xanthobacteraceae bacterium Astr-EGSB]|uniref:Na(+)/H(+) antiporter subunit D n=1 Tax=Astrobacterium formosum TaxID=3069710 RepID=UPI0027B058F9|nr:Na(+)/H(+) antiporter subunit D [Xanthobacteraceae bacterium Astr-EGSB]